MAESNMRFTTIGNSVAFTLDLKGDGKAQMLPSQTQTTISPSQV